MYSSSPFIISQEGSVVHKNRLYFSVELRGGPNSERILSNVYNIALCVSQTPSVRYKMACECWPIG